MDLQLRRPMWGFHFKSGNLQGVFNRWESHFSAIQLYKLNDVSHHATLALAVLARNITPCAGANVSPMGA